MLEKSLITFGLTPNEAKLYLSALKLGDVLASTLARQTKINRVTVYSVIASLQKKGFMSSYEKKGIKYFTAVDPEVILNWGTSQLIGQQQKLTAFREIIPSLTSLTLRLAADYPKVRVFEGVEGVRNIFEDTLKERKEIFAFSYIDKIFSLLGEDYTDNYIKNRQKLGIHVNMISPHSDWFK